MKTDEKGYLGKQTEDNEGMNVNVVNAVQSGS